MLRQRECAIYVYDIPFDILHEICKTLDVDNGWKALAAKCGYSFDKVKSFDLEYSRQHGSPTERLIGDWGVRNPTIHDFYEKLKTIDRIREMRLLEPLLKAAREHEKRQAEAREAERLKEAQSNQTNEARNTQSNKNKAAKNIKSSDFQQQKNPYKGDKPGVNKPVNQEPQNKLDDGKHNYESLNPSTKAFNKTKLGIPLEATNVYQNLNGKNMMESQEENLPSKISEENGAKGNNSGNKCKLPSQSSLDSNIGLLLSEDERASAMSLTPSQGEIDKDIAVAVSATPSFTYKDLSQATDGFSEGNKIGEGAFGNVYRGVLKQSRCAVKRLKQSAQWKKSNEQITHNSSEIKSLMRYRHENIVQLYGIAMDEDELCLVYQFMDNGSLEDRLQCRDNSVPLTWSRRINILRGAACAIQYLHTMDTKKPLIHGDIKSPNILLDRHFEAKISDLGLAEYANAGQVTGMFTHVTKKSMDSKMYSSKAYLPPEYYSNGPSTKSDTYGFGVIILETCTGEKAYDEKREGDRLLAPYAKTLLEGTPEDDWSKYLTDKKAGPCPNQIHHLLNLASKCISERKKDRPVMTDTLKQLEWICDLWNRSPSQSDGSQTNPEEEPGHVNNQNCQQDPRVPGQIKSPVHENRKMSLPCYPTMPHIADGRFTKSQSLDEEPESMRLQKIYDQQQYREKIRALGREAFPEQTENTTDSAKNGNMLPWLPVDPLTAAVSDGNGLPWLPVDPSTVAVDSVSLSDTLTADSLPKLGEYPEFTCDPAKLRAMEDFDEGQFEVSEANVNTEEAYAAQKLQAMQLFDEQNSTEQSKDEPSCDGELEGENVTDVGVVDNESEQVTQQQAEQAGASQEDTLMSSFFNKYAEETAQCEDKTSEDQGETTGVQGMVYCGINNYEGQQMAILLDPTTEQYYAVDPSTLDPTFYHKQQVQYYTEFQTTIDNNIDGGVQSEPNA